MVMLLRWLINGEKMVMSTEMDNLMEGEWSYLRRWQV